VNGDPWSAETRADEHVVAAKLRSYADGLLPPDRLERAITTVLGQGSVNDIRELTALLVR
jgi:hypothetical protein